MFGVLAKNLWDTMKGVNSLGNLHRTERLLPLKGWAQGTKALPGFSVLCKGTDGAVSPPAAGTGMNFTRVP